MLGLPLLSHRAGRRKDNLRHLAKFDRCRMGSCRRWRLSFPPGLKAHTGYSLCNVQSRLTRGSGTAVSFRGRYYEIAVYR